MAWAVWVLIYAMFFPAFFQEVFHRFSSDLTVQRLIAGAVVVKDLRAEARYPPKFFKIELLVAYFKMNIHNIYIYSYIYTYIYILIVYDDIYHYIIIYRCRYSSLNTYRYQCTK